MIMPRDQFGGSKQFVFTDAQSGVLPGTIYKHEKFMVIPISKPWDTAESYIC